MHTKIYSSKSVVKRCRWLVALASGLLVGHSALAAVTFTITPSAVSNTYSGLITLSIGGLTNTETVVVQKFLDLNTNGVIDGTDWLVQQFTLQDGTNFVIGGVTNFNVPGDLNATTGAITATLNFKNGDFAQNIIGKYLYKLSSPAGHFPPLTNNFIVTNFPFAQKFTGLVVSNRTSTTVSNAIVLLFPPPRPGNNGPGGSPLAGAVANNAGSYTVQAPPGTYTLVSFRNNFLANMNTAPVLTLAASQTITTNLTLTNATSSITGKIMDANNASIGLPGMISAMSANGLIAITFTDTNGNFNMPATAGTWKIQADDMTLIVHGYLGLQNGTNVNAGITGVTIAVPKATALFYGSVKDGTGNPLPGIDIYAYDNNNQYQTDGYTDANGKYVVGVLGGLGGNDPWSLQISGDSSPTNYLFSQPAFDQNGGTNLSAGATVQVKFTALLATNHITGWLKDNSGNPIASVGVRANATIGGVDYSQGSVSTDTNGNYWLNVANGTWTVGVNTCGGCSDGLPGSYFPPANQSVVIANNNGTANFTALLPTNHVSGWLKDSSGSPIVGVMVWASATINSVNYFQYVNTDVSGNYLLGLINGSWMVGVEQGGGGNGLPSNYLAPANQSVVIANNNGTANFTALSATNHISGWLKDNNGNPIVGVGIWADATINGVYYNQGTVDTDASGNYWLNVANGTWTVGVNSGGGGDSLSGNYLDPANQSVVISNNNATVNFTAILATNHITGHVQQSNGNPIGYVMVWASATINSVDYFQYVDADGNGNYSLNVANSSWTVGVECGSNGGDGLDDILGSGNYMCPDNQTVTINNNNGTANFTVQPCGGVQIFTTSLPDGQVGSYYDQFLQGSSCSGNLNWSLNDPQDFPSGLTLESWGEIDGTPDTAGTYNFSVHLDDGNGHSTNQSLSLTIITPPPLLSTPVKIAGGQLQLSLNGNAGNYYTIEYSTNLVNWVPLLITNPPSAQPLYLDFPTTNKAGFYQAYQSGIVVAQSVFSFGTSGVGPPVFYVTITNGAGTAVIPITRTGGLSNNVCVNYSTSDGTAIGGCDYMPTSGTLCFAAGVTSLSISIPVSLGCGTTKQSATVNLQLSDTNGTVVLNAVLVIQRPKPVLAVYPTSLTLVVPGNCEQDITISNAGPTGSVLNYLVADDGALGGFLNLSPNYASGDESPTASGSLQAGQTAQVVFTVLERFATNWNTGSLGTAPSIYTPGAANYAKYPISVTITTEILTIDPVDPGYFVSDQYEPRATAEYGFSYGLYDQYGNYLGYHPLTNYNSQDLVGQNGGTVNASTSCEFGSVSATASSSANVSANSIAMSASAGSSAVMAGSFSYPNYAFQYGAGVDGYGSSWKIVFFSLTCGSSFSLVGAGSTDNPIGDCTGALPFVCSDVMCGISTVVEGTSFPLYSQYITGNFSQTGFLPAGSYLIFIQGYTVQELEMGTNSQAFNASASGNVTFTLPSHP